MFVGGQYVVAKQSLALECLYEAPNSLGHEHIRRLMFVAFWVDGLDDCRIAELEDSLEVGVREGPDGETERGDISTSPSLAFSQPSLERLAEHLPGDGLIERSSRSVVFDAPQALPVPRATSRGHRWPGDRGEPDVGHPAGAIAARLVDDSEDRRSVIQGRENVSVPLGELK